MITWKKGQGVRIVGLAFCPSVKFTDNTHWVNLTREINFLSYCSLAQYKIFLLNVECYFI